MIYQLKISLDGAKPPIWRRILVPPSIHLGQLHDLIQIAMGWGNCHLHQFIVGNIFYGVPANDFGDAFGLEMRDETKYKLSRFLKKEKNSLRYEYDFGDGWEHKILLEKKLPDDDSRPLCTCIKGKRACPPDDCGGIWGYQEMLEILKDPSHPEYEDWREWVDDEFDPEFFDLDETNQLLAEYSTF